MNDQLKTVSAMNKLYIGNLPTEADEAAVRQLFAEHNLTVADISVKRGGYAFVDFPDQSAADRAIDKLHGYSYCGLPLIVEPSVANKKIVNVPNLQSASTTQLKEPSTDSSTTGGGWRPEKLLASAGSKCIKFFNFVVCSPEWLITYLVSSNKD